MSHTPGPWELSGECRESHGFVVAFCQERGVYPPPAELTVGHQHSGPIAIVSTGDGDGNALLIAAAPELLAACEAAQCSCTVKERDSGHLVGCWMPAMIDAVVKASGPTPT